jgi:tRNA pseudouridine55 synthase
LSLIHGLLLIDKPQGLTSHDVVARVRKILNTREVGHCGTLDPMATGLMILAIGEGLKLVSVVSEGDKGYQGQIQFGISTDTLDATGTVIETGMGPKSEVEIQNAALELMGSHELKVPRYSAVKVNGERLYEKARDGDDFTAPSRLMTFFDLKMGTFNGERWDFEFVCSKGSFVRSWMAALCQKLAVPGTLSALRRTYSSPYHIDQAIEIDRLAQLMSEKGETGVLSSSSFISLAQALPDWNVLRAYHHDLHLLKNGQISKNLKAQLIRSYQPGVPYKGCKVLAENTSQLVALIGFEFGKGFFIKRGFHFK